MTTVRWLAAAGLAMSTWGCGGSPGGVPAPKASALPAATVAAVAAGLTPWQVDHGIGPVTSPLPLGAVDNALAASGKAIFDVKCMTCHKLDEKYVGPSLGDVTVRRTPEYVMNMILNPAEMIQKHPEAKKLLAIHLVPMTFQNVTQDDARALLEYLRSVAPAAGT